jgi:REP element-mobilizing transposase RayT
VERYRIHSDATLYYCTFAVIDWLPVFVNGRANQMISDSVRFCHEQKHLGIDSYVVMPTHLHLIVFDQEWDSARLERTLTDFRKFTGRQLVEFCSSEMPSCFNTALVNAAGDDREHRFWQATRHPEYIESVAFHKQKRDYLHDNPRRKGLVLHPAHWRWSSARWYETGEDCDVPITPVTC